MSHTRYAPARQRLQRSELAVPGSNPALFAKAAASDVDYVFLDLEDAVAPGDKEQARRNVIKGLRDIDWRGLGKTISVRINGIDTHYMYRDVVDVVEQAGESAAEKIQIMRDCGVIVVERPSDFGAVISKIL
jgi:citrate lyase subunit beta/citryl-CoA lyase